MLIYVEGKSQSDNLSATYDEGEQVKGEERS